MCPHDGVDYALISQPVSILPAAVADADVVQPAQRYMVSPGTGWTSVTAFTGNWLWQSMQILEAVLLCALMLVSLYNEPFPLDCLAVAAGAGLEKIESNAEPRGVFVLKRLFMEFQLAC
jgi:hypothetical protein